MDCSVSSEPVDALEPRDFLTILLPFRVPAERFLPLGCSSALVVEASKLLKVLCCRSIFWQLCNSVVLPEELDCTSLSVSMII